MPSQDDRKPQPPPQMDTLRASLANTIGHWTLGQENVATPIQNLFLFRREAPTHPCACVVEPSIVFVVQGAKQLLIGDRAYAYDRERFLITSLDLPASSQVLEASSDMPCLGLALRLDLRVIAEMVAHSDMPPPRDRVNEASAILGALTHTLLEPFSRLLDLLDEPASIAMLAPLIEREIHYRLLMSDQGARVRQIASMDSQRHRIARAIDWLKSNYAESLRIDDLAAHVHMSASSLHHHFRQLTAMSPLQYQKWLRLHEARHLMLNARLDAASAAFRVGYESASQFSREYGRLFGAPPKRDIEGLRQQVAEAGPSALPLPMR